MADSPGSRARLLILVYPVKQVNILKFVFKNMTNQPSTEQVSYDIYDSRYLHNPGHAMLLSTTESLEEALDDLEFFSGDSVIVRSYAKWDLQIERYVQYKAEIVCKEEQENCVRTGLSRADIHEMFEPFIPEPVVITYEVYDKSWLVNPKQECMSSAETLEEAKAEIIEYGYGADTVIVKTTSKWDDEKKAYFPVTEEIVN